MKNIFEYKIIAILAMFFGVVIFFSFAPTARSESVHYMGCQDCGGTSGSCKNVRLSEEEYTINKIVNASNKCSKSCDYAYRAPVLDGECPGSKKYACDNCYNDDGSCATVSSVSIEDARESCKVNIHGCAAFETKDISLAFDGKCSMKIFNYEVGLDNCTCDTIKTTDLKIAGELSGITFSSDISTCSREIRVGGCPAKVTTDPDKKPDASIPSGKSAEDLLKEAARELNPARINQPTDLIGKAIKMLLAFIGSISLVLYVYAGILWLSASGASERVDKAKKILVWTTLGVVVMLGSYMLVNFAFRSLQLIK